MVIWQERRFKGNFETNLDSFRARQQKDSVSFVPIPKPSLSPSSESRPSGESKHKTTLTASQISVQHSSILSLIVLWTLQLGSDESDESPNPSLPTRCLCTRIKSPDQDIMRKMKYLNAINFPCNGAVLTARRIPFRAILMSFSKAERM